MNSTEIFEAERQRLFGISYRMLGSVEEADDVVQEAWLRWNKVDPATIKNPAGFLTTVASRLAIDRLRNARLRRETYIGPWLPEPLATARSNDPASAAIMHESIMLGFLAVLERLGAVERAVFVLREVFDLPYPAVASIVDRSEANCRQIAKRARDHVRLDRPRVAPDLERDRRLLDAFLVALATGDSDELGQLLHDDVVLVSDGGANVRAARKPVVGVGRVTRFLQGLSKRPDAEELAIGYVSINGQLALQLTFAHSEMTILAVEPDGSGDQILRMFALRNPDKLTGVAR